MRETKAPPDKAPARREPRQARALHKVELIMEAAMRLLNEGDLSTLTTNAVAERAGVSIGTLYQYFNDKEAILDSLAQRELGAMAGETMRSLTTKEQPATPGDRIRLVVRTVLGAYGGSDRVHRMLLEYRLGRGAGGALDPLFAGITKMMASSGVVGPDGKARPVSPADSFVLTYAIAGVLRAYVARNEAALGRQDLEDSLVRLTMRFLGLDEGAREVTPGATAARRLAAKPRRPSAASRISPG